MKILFALNHPAHYHLFKHAFSILRRDGHDTFFVIKDKDILSQLLDSEKVDHHILTIKKIGHNKISVLAKGAFDIIIQDYRLLLFCREHRPDLMIGTDYSITHVGRLLGIESLVFNEDDFAINKLFCTLAYPFATAIVSPFVCDVGKSKHKKIGYNGYQKLAYLHPVRFKPDINVIRKYFDPNRKIFLIRLVRFAAGHDIEMKHSGITIPLLEKICLMLNPFGQVFISSEASIPAPLKKYSLKIDPKDIHHILAFADMFIADSQSMIVEAAMLGTPCIRFNSFVGKISVLEELEKKFKLAIGINVTQPEELIVQIKKNLDNENIKKVYARRRQQMLAEKIDLTGFIVWLIDNYPRSLAKAKNNSQIQNEFIKVIDYEY